MKEELKETSVITEKDVSRRRFLSYAGLAGAALVISSCGKDDDDPEPVPAGSVDFGSGDIGLLNYAFALEQLEAAFYTQVCASPYTNGNEAEMKALVEIRDHEIAHREFFRNLLKEDRIEDLEFDFSSVNFTDRWSVLMAAKEMEALGVSAYMGVAKRFVTVDYLLHAMKILSVEARHSSYLEDTTVYNSFAEKLDSNAMDVEMTPEAVLTAAAKYFKNSFSTTRLPKS